MGNNDPMINQLHDDISSVKEELKENRKIQSDMRDAILILTENQKRMDEIHNWKESINGWKSETNTDIALIQKQLDNHHILMQSVPQNTFTNKVIGAISMIIGAGLISYIVNILIK